MKITGISVTSLMDSDSGSDPGRSGYCWVELRSEGALSGVAVARSWAGPAILGLAEDLLIGEDFRAVTTHWQRMGELMGGRADGAMVHARAALDIAAWDLKAKAQSEPLWKALGGGRPRANAYLSCIDAAADAKEHAKEQDEDFTAFLDLASSGLNLRGGKLAVGLNPEHDAWRLAQLREALQPFTHEPQLMIDAGGRWRPKDAIRHIRALESRCDLTWVQGVAECGDFLGSRKVSDSIRAALCAGRDLTTLSAFLPWFHHQSANVIEIDMHHFGVTGAMQLADAAYGYELPVTLTAMPGNIHAHLAAVMPSFMSMEVLPPDPHQTGIKSDVRFESGWGIAGDTPGCGLTVTPK